MSQVGPAVASRLRLDVLAPEILAHVAVERQSGVIAEHLYRVVRAPPLDEIPHASDLSHGRVETRRVVPLPVPDLLPEFLVEDVHPRGLLPRLGFVPPPRGLAVDLLEDAPRVEHPRIDPVGGHVPRADEEDLRALAPARRGLHGLDRSEELLRDPQVRAVIPAPVQLRDEGAVLLQVLRGAPERVQRYLVLLVRVPVVARAHVRRPVAQHHVGAGPLHRRAYRRLALLGGDVAEEGDDVPHGADGEYVDGDDGRGRVVGEGAGAHLRPSAGRGAQIEDRLGIVEDGEFAIDLRQLEGRAGSESLLLGHCVAARLNEYI